MNYYYYTQTRPDFVSRAIYHDNVYIITMWVQDEERLATQIQVDDRTGERTVLPINKHMCIGHKRGKLVLSYRWEDPFTGDLVEDTRPITPITEEEFTKVICL